MLDGAPTMPTVGPSGSAVKNLSSTCLGASFFPMINRADVRLSAACTRSPIRTNKAPFDLLSRMFALPRLGVGLKKARTPAAPVMRTAMTKPTMRDLTWPRIGSWIMRESARISACSSRLIRNRYPLTCARVVTCAATAAPSAGERVEEMPSTTRVPLCPGGWLVRKAHAGSAEPAAPKQLAAAAEIFPQRALPLPDLLIVEAWVAAGIVVALLLGFRGWYGAVAGV